MISRFPSVEHSYGAELARKTIHLFSLSIPIVYSLISKETALAILIPLTLLFTLTDLSRFRSDFIGQWYNRLFGWLMRPHERDGDRKRLNGATYVLLSACLGIALLPKVIFLTAFSILIVSDSLAAIVGRRFGRHPFLDKSAEGAAAFFFSAIIVVLVAPKISGVMTEYILGGIAAVVGTVVEAMNTGLDDNLTIPFAIGVSMWILYALALPTTDVFALDAIR